MGVWAPSETKSLKCVFSVVGAVVRYVVILDGAYLWQAALYGASDVFIVEASGKW